MEMDWNHSEEVSQMGKETSEPAATREEAETPDELADDLTYGLLQIGAEAFAADSDGVPGAGSRLVTDKNFRKSLPTIASDSFFDVSSCEIEQFFKNWKVVDQIRNLATGFAGTVFKALSPDPEGGILKDGQVISLCCAEFDDDAVCGRPSGSVLRAQRENQVFGQISDMRSWVNLLYARNLISGSVVVTSHSSGDHLMTAFKLLFPDDLAAMYTFSDEGSSVIFRAGLWGKK
jgi:hypothetical protein